MVAAGCGSACAGGRRCLPCAARHYTRLAAQCGRCAGYKALRSTVNFNARAWHAFLVAVGPNRGVQWTRAVERCGALCEASDRIHQIEIGRVASCAHTHTVPCEQGSHTSHCGYGCPQFAATKLHRAFVGYVAAVRCLQVGVWGPG